MNVDICETQYIANRLIVTKKINVTIEFITSDTMRF